MNRQTLIGLVAVAVTFLAAILFLALQPPQDGPRYQTPGPIQGNGTPITERFGYTPNPEGVRAFLATLPRPTLRQAGPQLFAAKDDQDVYLWRALYKAYGDYSGGAQWVVGRQGIGDCVSWGWAHGADVHLAVMYGLGDTGEWRPAATEPIYGGSRCEALGKTFAGYSDGSYGAAAAKWVKEFGILFRQHYDSIDLTTYSASLAKEWGAYGCGGRGDGGKLDTVAKEHPIHDVALVETFEDAARAIQSGYTIPVCSMVGFTSTRDGQGFLRASGSWAHCMCFIAVRFDRPGLLCLNSWGPSWVKGPKVPEDMPDGSFWVERSTVDRMLKQRDSFAVSGYVGFPKRKLDHGAWVQRHWPRSFAEQIALLDQRKAVGL